MARSDVEGMGADRPDGKVLDGWVRGGIPMARAGVEGRVWLRVY